LVARDIPCASHRLVGYGGQLRRMYGRRPFDRPGRGGDRRFTVIDRCRGRLIAHRGLLMLHLHRSRCLMRRAGGSLFGGSRLRRDPTPPAVEANPAARGVADRLLIHIVNVGDIHVAHRGVVIEMLPLPVPARVTLAEITVTVRNAAVEPDRWAPVAGVPSEPFVAPSPIPGRPEQPNFRRLHPSAGDPEVPVLVVGPISRGPDRSLFHEDRLFVLR